MRILICDDDSSITQSLSQIIKVYFKKKKVNVLDIVTFNDGDSLLSDKSQKDIVFLDIEMPEVNGFELFSKVNKDSFEVVFVTAYSQFLEKSVNEIGCFGYLQKPLEREKLLKIFERYQEKNTHKNYLKLANTSQSKRTLIKLEEVMFCKADDNYSEIYTTTDKTKHILSKTLGDLEKKLPQQLFQRVHRSYIVNMSHVSYFEKDKNLLVIHQPNETEAVKIPVSTKYKEAIRQLFL